jgi:hypothetical protein
MWATSHAKEGDTRSLKQKVREEMQNARIQVRRTHAERRSFARSVNHQDERRQEGSAN